MLMKQRKGCTRPTLANENIQTTGLLLIHVMRKSEMKGKNMKNNILFVITTYNRPETLIYILDILYNLGDIIIFNDGSNLEYHGIERFNGLIYVKSNINHGKSCYYNVINHVFSTIKGLKKYDYYMFLPDDFDPVDGFLEKSIEIWKSIQDNKKICLNLYQDKGRFMTGSWTGFDPVIYDAYLKTQWVDMCFLCEYKFFEVLDWKVEQPSSRVLSSGVGKNISIRLSINYSLYQVKFSMFTCLPDGRKSKMFAHERHMHVYPEMLPRKNKIWKTIGIASIPERKKQLENTVKSLINQCDLMVIALNNYKSIPEFAKHEKIEAVLMDNRYGDAAKFIYAWNDGYYFSCDDDILYPSDYIEKMTEKIEFYGNNCIITLHGRKMKQKPLKSYYQGHEKTFNLFYDVEKDTRIDVGGTGVMAFDTEFFKINYRKCVWPNMADIWVAKFAIQQNVPIILAAHKGSDFIYQRSEKTIYEKHKKDDKIQTQLYNNI